MHLKKKKINNLFDIFRKFGLKDICTLKIYVNVVILISFIFFFYFYSI